MSLRGDRAKLSFVKDRQRGIRQNTKEDVEEWRREPGGFVERFVRRFDRLIDGSNRRSNSYAPKLTETEAAKRLTERWNSLVNFAAGVFAAWLR
jgi:hypothetical protein